MSGNKQDQEQTDLLGPLTRSQARIIQFAGEIATSPSDRPDFLHTVLCQVGLPRSSTPQLRFERRNGKASLLLEAGSIWNKGEWHQQLLPTGAKPRLALVHISTQAVLNRTATIDVGKSMREFMTRLGVGTNGREFKAFRQQLRALSACRMTLGYGDMTIDAKPIERFSTWSTESRPRDIETGIIELSSKFYDSLIESAVPLDPRALACLQNSALALDVYTWLSHRLHRVSRSSGERVTWKNLTDQFGQEYADPKDFKRKFQKVLRPVRCAYPDARLEEVYGGIILLPSKPPVPARTSLLIEMKTAR